MQIVSDVLGRELHAPLITIGACFGDALMAATGIKYKGFEDFSALSDHIKPDKIYKPNLENHQKYQAIYERMYPQLKTFMHELSHCRK